MALEITKKRCRIRLLSIITIFKFKWTAYFYKSPFSPGQQRRWWFWYFLGEGWFPNNQTKELVCEAEGTGIHLRLAEQACLQGNTSGEGQQSTLWPCWRQWHNSNSYRVRASSFQSWVSFSLLQAAAKASHGATLQTKLAEVKSQSKTHLDYRAFMQEAECAGTIIFWSF